MSGKALTDVERIKAKSRYLRGTIAESLADPERRERYMSRIPLRRPADPSEIARMAYALCSGDASYVTGAYLPVDGGWLAG